MNVPLGNAVGNALEVKEAIAVLQGKGPADLKELSVVLASQMLSLASGEDIAITREKCEIALSDGTAFNKFKEMIAAQGGDLSYIDHSEKFALAEYPVEVKAQRSGYIESMDCEAIGKTATLLGAGREKKGDTIDMSAGIILLKKTGDFAEKGETLAVLHTNRKEKTQEAVEAYQRAITLSDTKPSVERLIYEIL